MADVHDVPIVGGGGAGDPPASSPPATAAMPFRGGVTGETRVVAEWDAGDMGCGELLLELRTQLDTLPPGQIMKLTARDPGAPADIPAWCRLTGHTLMAETHPVYLIQRKED